MTRTLSGARARQLVPHFTRLTIAGACNEPVPYNWKNACRRRPGHRGQHHYWDPRTGTDRGRHPKPFRDDDGRPIPAVWAWGGDGPMRDVRMLDRHAYVAPARTDRALIAVVRSWEQDHRR